MALKEVLLRRICGRAVSRQNAPKVRGFLRPLAALSASALGPAGLAELLQCLRPGPGSPVLLEFSQKFPAVGLGDALAPPADAFGMAALVQGVVEGPEAVRPLAVLAALVFPIAEISAGVYPSGHGQPFLLRGMNTH
jgi:hypothetical protein